MKKSIVIELSVEDYELVLLGLGSAAGVAHRDGLMQIASEFWRLGRKLIEIPSGPGAASTK